MYTGHDARYGGEPIDISGGGYDPSAYYSQSPGGRFRGDTQNYLDYLIGLDQGTAGNNPDYDVPSWAERLPGLYGRFAKWHEQNVRTGGTGNAPDFADPSLYLYSGPAARYGPPGGPLHGLLDQERPHNWDGTDGNDADPGQPVGGGRRGGGGGAAQPNFTFQPYAGLNHTPSFVGWQPDRPLSQPTQFVYGQSTRQAAPAPAPAPGGPGGGGGVGGGRSGGRQRGPNQVPPSGTGPTGNKPGGGGRGGQPTQDDFLAFLDEIFGGVSARGPRAAADNFRQGFGAGVDMNLLDKGTPGWTRDRTLNPNMAGHRTPDTIPQPRAGQSVQEYMDELARQGVDTESIASLLGPNGFRVGDDGKMTGEWGWGTGPVTRGDNGYQFANQGGGQAPGSGYSMFGPGPGNNRGPGGGFSLFDRRPGGEDRQQLAGGVGGLMDLILGSGVFAR